jgi:hypothetical protein
VNLHLTLDFLRPLLPQAARDFLFELVNTPNGSDVEAAADFVTLPATAGEAIFLIRDTEYRLSLTSFENIIGDGYLYSDAHQFHVREGATARADLYAMLSQVPAVPAVPEPQTYALLLAGLLIMGFVARRRI